MQVIFSANSLAPRSSLELIADIRKNFSNTVVLVFFPSCDDIQEIKFIPPSRTVREGKTSAADRILLSKFQQFQKLAIQARSGAIEE